MFSFVVVYDLETGILRYFNVYGEGMSADGGYPLAMAKFLKQKAEDKPLTILGRWGAKERFYIRC